MRQKRQSDWGRGSETMGWRLLAGQQAASTLDRLLAGLDLTCPGRLLDLVEQLAEARSGGQPDRLGELVAANDRRAGSAGTPRERLAKQLARELDMLSNRDLGL